MGEFLDTQPKDRLAVEVLDILGTSMQVVYLGM
jgi:hypothetical protein